VRPELVAHFDRRGRLSPAQIRRLLEQGFLAADAPANMIDLGQPVGATYYFRVTGESNGPCWGRDVYTGATSIAIAAVPIGLVKGGMSAIIRVEAVSPPTEFQGSARHGVTSHDFGRYGSAYRLAAV